MARQPVQPARTRRGHLRRTFDARVDQEWNRYAGEARRLLQRTLRERFLRRHVDATRETLLELGPGPGRFTPLLRQLVRGRVLALDLSRESLVAGRRRARRGAGPAQLDFLQGAGEHLPLPSRSVDAVVALGNIVSFAARDGPALLTELHRVLRRKGILVLDFPSPAASIQEFLHLAARGRFLSKVLRRPDYYYFGRVLDSGYQPYAPARLARWEFQFYTVADATRELSRAGFRAVDAMSVAPLAAHQDRIATIARRERKTWETLLTLEEQVGRRRGMQESGHGFVVAAVRR
ncbi:MAG: class I SAM-dependent methyltransferase [Thermoplasmata archaeon]|nr:class I SAM-dependent methyltransferase [Thermoplasmata archaeon]